MRRAREAGLDVIALTDHDTLAGHEEAREALPDGLTLVPGMELSCALGERSVHLLAYRVDPANEALAAECRAITADRLRRGRAMVDLLRGLGAEVSWPQVTAIAGGGVVGRPHIARAMVAAGVIERPDQAFSTEWLGQGGRAYVGRYAPAPGRAIALVRAAGGVAGGVSDRRTRGFSPGGVGGGGRAYVGRYAPAPDRAIALVRAAGGVAVLAHPGAAARGARMPDDVIAGLAPA